MFLCRMKIKDQTFKGYGESIKEAMKAAAKASHDAEVYATINEYKLNLLFFGAGYKERENGKTLSIGV